MTGIRKILDAEEAAQKRIEQAHTKATESLAIAKRKSTEKIDSTLRELEVERVDKLEAQKKDLAEIYQSIISKGKKSVDRLESEAGGKHRKALEMVIRSLTH